MNRINVAQQLQIDEMDLQVTDACKSLRSTMETFINFINASKEASFKVFVDTDNHNINGPNAFPIVFKSKKGKQPITLWASDCCKCRLESDKLCGGSSSGNLLFMEFQPKSYSPEIVVVSKKQNKTKQNKTINDEDENPKRENVNPNSGVVNESGEPPKNKGLEESDSDESRLSDIFKKEMNESGEPPKNEGLEESDSDESRLSDIFKKEMMGDDSSEELRMDVQKDPQISDGNLFY